MNNEKLEKHISEWKSITKKFKNKAIKYCKEMSKIFVILKKIKCELFNTCIE